MAFRITAEEKRFILRRRSQALFGLPPVEELVAKGAERLTGFLQKGPVLLGSWNPKGGPWAKLTKKKLPPGVLSKVIAGIRREVGRQGYSFLELSSGETLVLPSGNLTKV